MNAEIYFDGGARPTNPGHAGFGVLVRLGRREVKVGRYIGNNKTNNQAEYAGLIVGMKIALDEGATDVTITGDSKLVIEQVQGNWMCKSDVMRPLLAEASALAEKFQSIEWIHVRGHQGHIENEIVDGLATDAIKAGIKKNGNPFTKKTMKKTEGKIVDPFQ